MAFRFQCLSSLWHLEHLQLIVSFADCCLSTDDKYCRAPQTSRAIFSSSVSQLSCFVANFAVLSSTTGKKQEGPGSQLGLGVTSPVQPHTELRSIFMKADAETLQTFWGNESQTVPFCPSLGPVSHFKPSYHKRSTKDNSAEVYFPPGAEIREGRAGDVALAGEFGTKWYLRSLPTSNILWFLFKAAIKSSKYHL